MCCTELVSKGAVDRLVVACQEFAADCELAGRAVGTGPDQASRASR